MIRMTLFFAAATTLIPAAAPAQAPCSLLTPDQIKAVLSVPVNPGQPGGTKGSPDCTLKDAKGEDRVYVSLKPRDTFNVTRAQVANTGRLALAAMKISPLGDKSQIAADSARFSRTREV